MVLSFVLVRNFVKSSYGRACISVREDEVAAEAMGVNLTRTKMIAFVVGTALAGFAGALYAGLSLIHIYAPNCSRVQYWQRGRRA